MHNLKSGGSEATAFATRLLKEFDNGHIESMYNRKMARIKLPYKSRTISDNGDNILIGTVFEVMRVGSDTFGNPFIQKSFKN